MVSGKNITSYYSSAFTTNSTTTASNCHSRSVLFLFCFPSLYLFSCIHAQQSQSQVDEFIMIWWMCSSHFSGDFCFILLCLYFSGTESTANGWLYAQNKMLRYNSVRVLVYSAGSFLVSSKSNDQISILRTNLKSRFLYGNRTVYLSFIDHFILLQFISMITRNHCFCKLACLACPKLKLHAECAIKRTLTVTRIAHY